MSTKCTSERCQTTTMQLPSNLEFSLEEISRELANLGVLENSPTRLMAIKTDLDELIKADQLLAKGTKNRKDCSCVTHSNTVSRPNPVFKSTGAQTNNQNTVGDSSPDMDPCNEEDYCEMADQMVCPRRLPLTSTDKANQKSLVRIRKQFSSSSNDSECASWSTASSSVANEGAIDAATESVFDEEIDILPLESRNCGTGLTQYSQTSSHAPQTSVCVNWQTRKLNTGQPTRLNNNEFTAHAKDTDANHQNELGAQTQKSKILPSVQITTTVEEDYGLNCHKQCAQHLCSKKYLGVPTSSFRVPIAQRVARISAIHQSGKVPKKFHDMFVPFSTHDSRVKFAKSHRRCTSASSLNSKQDTSSIKVQTIENRNCSRKSQKPTNFHSDSSRSSNDESFSSTISSDNNETVASMKSNIPSKTTANNTNFVRRNQLSTFQNNGDPVSLFHAYKRQWGKRNIPGESARRSLRWSVKAAMMIKEVPILPSSARRSKLATDDWIKPYKRTSVSTRDCWERHVQ